MRPSPSRHGARTSVTQECMDIGYTFGSNFRSFQGYALESHIVGSSARAFYKTGL